MSFDVHFEIVANDNALFTCQFLTFPICKYLASLPELELHITEIRTREKFLTTYSVALIPYNNDR